MSCLNLKFILAFTIEKVLNMLGFNGYYLSNKNPEMVFSGICLKKKEKDNG